MIDYKSPIEIWHSEMEMQLEGEVLKSCQRVGVNVDRDELLKALKYDRGQFDKGYQYGLNADKWIPCEERLPSEENEDYLICTNEAHVRILLWTKRGWNTFIDSEGKYHTGAEIKNVIAWQPLPQPYKEGDTDE